eukprot:2608791-Rhodomonas_salina.1
MTSTWSRQKILQTILPKDCIMSSCVAETSNVPNSTLQLALALSNDGDFDALECLQDTYFTDSVPCRCKAAVINALQHGCNPKLVGHLLCELLGSYDMDKAESILKLMQEGGIVKYKGEIATQPSHRFRQTTSGECVLYKDKIYNGPFIAGRMCGQGTLKNTSGNILYNGYFFDNRPHGTGMTFHTDGTCEYSGNFCHGQPHGLGTFQTHSTNASGEWIYGKLICNNAKITEKNNKQQAFVYKGGVFDMKYHGRGDLKIFHHSQGQIQHLLSHYEGYFFNNKRHGIGVFSTEQRHTFGIWWNGALRFTLFSKNGTFPRPSLDKLMTQQMCDDEYQCIDKNVELLTLSFNQPKNSKENDSQTEESSFLLDQQHQSFTTNESLRTHNDKCENFSIYVYSFCTLTSIPRKECTLHNTLPLQCLSRAFTDDTLFITATKGAFVIGDFRENTLLTSIVCMESPFICVIKCTHCMKSASIHAASPFTQDCKYQLFVCSVCLTGNKQPKYLFCYECAKQKNIHSNTSSSSAQQFLSPVNTLFKLETGISHMNKVHNISNIDSSILANT